MKNLYVGTAGVLWALDELRRRGHAESKLDLADLAQRNVDVFRARPDIAKWAKLPGPPESGFLLGESGILLVAYGSHRVRNLQTTCSPASAQTSKPTPTSLLGRAGDTHRGAAHARVDRRCPLAEGRP